MLDKCEPLTVTRSDTAASVIVLQPHLIIVSVERYKKVAVITLQMTASTKSNAEGGKRRNQMCQHSFLLYVGNPRFQYDLTLFQYEHYKAKVQKTSQENP